jgi:hypothetical protein
MTQGKRVLVVGNTFPVKEELKRLGGEWDVLNHGWLVPKERSAEARYVVAAAGGKKMRRTATTAPSRSKRTARPRQRDYEPCGSAGCSSEHCSECDGVGMGGCR